MGALCLSSLIVLSLGQSKGDQSLFEWLGEMFEERTSVMKNRPPGRESVIERAGRIEERIREIEQSSQPERQESELQRLDGTLRELRGYELWPERNTIFTVLDVLAEHLKNITPWNPEAGADGLVFWRASGTFDLVFDPSLRTVVQCSLSRTWGANHESVREQDRFDLTLAKVMLRLYEYDLEIPLELSVGRMGLSVGDERMVGTDGWQNFWRVFDGARAFNRTWLGETMHSACVDTQAFWGRPSGVRPGVTSDQGVNTSDPDVNLYGLSAELRAPDFTMIGAYYLFDSDANPDNVGDFGVGGRRIDSVGLRWSREIFKLMTLSGETAYQWGEFAGEDHRAWALHGSLNLHMANWKTAGSLNGAVATGLALEYDYASGDKDPFDGRHGTFVPPYPSPHKLHGFADLLGWRNIEDLAVRLRSVLWRHETFDTYIELGFHKFYLAQGRDACYGPRGEIARQDKTGAASRDLGNEIDLELSVGGWLSIGYSIFQAGHFFADTGGRQNGSLYAISIFRDW